MFNPATYGYPLDPSFDRRELKRLLDKFRTVVSRRIDVSVANKLEEELLGETPHITARTFRQFAKWCDTAGDVYRNGSNVAVQISLLLFARILDRSCSEK